MKNVVFSSRNRSKIAQVKGVFADSRFIIRSLDELGIQGEVEENGSSLTDNALLKALFPYQDDKGKGQYIVSEDTGLFINALDGRPGIHAARWAGPGKTTEEIMQFTLEAMKNVRHLHERVAFFQTIAVLISPVGEIEMFDGVMPGTILFEPQCECQPDMPYSAIFRPAGFDKVWAQMSLDEENAVSHRGRAFRKVLEYLNSTVPM